MGTKLYIIFILLVIQTKCALAQSYKQSVAKGDSVMRIPVKKVDDYSRAVAYYSLAENQAKGNETLLEQVITKRNNAQNGYKQAKIAAINKNVLANATNGILQSGGDVNNSPTKLLSLQFPEKYPPSGVTVSISVLVANISSLLEKLKTSDKKYEDDADINSLAARLYNSNYRYEDKLVYDSTLKVLSTTGKVTEDAVYMHLRASLFHCYNLIIEKKWDSDKQNIITTSIQNSINVASLSNSTSGKSYHGLAGLENLLRYYYENLDDQQNAYKHALLSAEYARKAVIINPGNSEFLSSLYTNLRNISFLTNPALSVEEKLKFSLLSGEIAVYMKNSSVNKPKALIAYTTFVKDQSDRLLESGKENEYLKANQLLTTTLEDFKGYNLQPANITSILSASLYTKLGWAYLSYKKDSANYKLSVQKGQQDFFNSLKGKISSQRLLDELEYSFENLFDNSALNNTTAERMTLYRKVIDNLEGSDNDYLDVKSLSLFYTNSYTNLAKLSLLLKTKTDTISALNYFSRAIEVFDKMDFKKYYNGFSEDYAKYCNMYGTIVKLYVSQGNFIMAKKHYDNMMRIFSPIYKEYRFDFYFGQHMVGSSMDYGKFLFSRNKYKEAIPPLELASFEGIKESTDLLIKIYNTPGTLNKIMSDSLNKRTNYQSNGIKRFTVPIQFKNLKENFNVYIMDRAKGYPYTGIRDQVMWLKEARGYEVADDVVSSFDKLQKLAWDNNVSFQDLCIYALGKTNNDAKTTNVSKDTTVNEYDLKKKNVKKLIAGKSAVGLISFYGKYLADKDFLRADSVANEILKLDDGIENRYYLSLLSYNFTSDSQTKRFLLNDKNKIQAYRSFFRKQNIPSLKTNRLFFAYYQNLCSLDSVAYKNSPVDSLKIEMGQDYNSLAYYSILNKQFKPALQYLEKSIAFDPVSKYPYTNFPAAYLFDNEFEKAKALYMKYKDLPFDNKYPTFKDVFLSDFKDFEKEGLKNDKVVEIIKLLNQ